VPLLYNDPEHWRERAEDARALARLMSDPVGKEVMMEIADSYDRLAARAVERLAQSSQGSTKPAA
jgi:CHASE3 domain sensor protein